MMKNADFFGSVCLSPADRCSETIRKYCGDIDLSQTSVREISTVINELYQCKLLHTVNSDDLVKYLELQNQILKRINYFPFDIIEIGLTIWASNDMHQSIYNDDWINGVINKLYMFYNEEVLKDIENHLLHRMFPVLRLLSKVIEQCYLNDSLLSQLVSVGVSSYFHEGASQSLQSSSCSILCSIFRRHRDFRSSILDEVFFTCIRTPGNKKPIIGINDDRLFINSISRLLFELIQSVSCFPYDANNDFETIILDIINRFIGTCQGKGSVSSRLMESFISDLSIALFCPFYPCIPTIMVIVISNLIKHCQKHNKLSRLSISSISIIISAIVKLKQDRQKDTQIHISKSIINSILQFDSEKINEIANNSDNRVFIDEEGIRILCRNEFPSNDFELVVSELMILLYIKQALKLSDIMDTATLCNISLWTNKSLNQEETDNLYLWWRGLIPVITDFTVKNDNALAVYMFLVNKNTVFRNIDKIVHEYLHGLVDSSSSHRGLIIKGFSLVISMKSDYLYHPILVSNIKNAFIDPCPAIREAVLTMITMYINKNDQIFSPYFNIVVKCLSDSSPIVMKKALHSIGSLTQFADEQQLLVLCTMLSQRISDPNPQISSSAKQLLKSAIFEVSKNPKEILFQMVNSSVSRLEWFQKFFKEAYIKYYMEIKNVIQLSISCLSEIKNIVEIKLIREFCDTLPSVCANYHESIITSFLSCSVDELEGVFIYSLIPLVTYITTPNITSFNLLLPTLIDCVLKKGSTIVRGSIQLISLIIFNIIPDDKSLTQLQNDFKAYLSNGLREKAIQIPQIRRAIFASGCIFRFHGVSNSKQFAQMMIAMITRYYNSDHVGLRYDSLQAACDICVVEPSLIEKARHLVKCSFEKGIHGWQEGLMFLRNLLEEEQNVEDKTSIDEIRPNYSNGLINEFLQKIIDCFKSSEYFIRDEALKFSRKALSYGMINPHSIIPYILSLISIKEHYSSVLDIMKEVVFSYESVLKSRIKDSIMFSFDMIYRNEISIESSAGLSGVFPILNSSLRQEMMNCLTDEISSCLFNDTGLKGTKKISWLINVIQGIQFQYKSEPKVFLKNLFSSSNTDVVNTIYNGAKNAIHLLSGKKTILEKVDSPYLWYSSIAFLKLKHWMMKRYHLNYKKIMEKVTPRDSKMPPKVAIIPPLTLLSNTIPKNEIITLDYDILNLFAQFQSILRHERAKEKKFQ